MVPTLPVWSANIMDDLQQLQDSFDKNLGKTEVKTDKPIKRIPVVEHFGPTIQGEGSEIGVQTMFLRLGGCDYKCDRCDSLHAVLPHMVKEVSDYLTIEEITQRVLEKQGHTPWLVISGGNPAMWDLSELITAVRGYGIKVAIETQGSIWQDWLMDCDTVTVSPKGPGMGETWSPEVFDVFQHNLQHHPDFAVKVVVFDQRDLEMAAEIAITWPQLALHERLFLSIGNVNPPAPAKRDVGAEDIQYQDLVMEMTHSYRQVAEEVMQDSRLAPYRLLPQLHCLIWGNKQGY